MASKLHHRVREARQGNSSRSVGRLHLSHATCFRISSVHLSQIAQPEWKNHCSPPVHCPYLCIHCRIGRFRCSICFFEHSSVKSQQSPADEKCPRRVTQALILPAQAASPYPSTEMKGGRSDVDDHAIILLYSMRVTWDPMLPTRMSALPSNSMAAAREKGTSSLRSSAHIAQNNHTEHHMTRTARAVVNTLSHF